MRSSGPISVTETRWFRFDNGAIRYDESGTMQPAHQAAIMFAPHTHYVVRSNLPQMKSTLIVILALAQTLFADSTDSDAAEAAFEKGWR